MVCLITSRYDKLRIFEICVVDLNLSIAFISQVHPGRFLKCYGEAGAATTVKDFALLNSLLTMALSPLGMQTEWTARDAETWFWELQFKLAWRGTIQGHLGERAPGPRVRSLTQEEKFAADEMVGRASSLDALAARSAAAERGGQRRRSK